MRKDDHQTVERHCDVAVIGGSGAGLAAALELGRRHRSVIVIDDGSLPSEPIAIGREEVRTNGGEVVAGRVVEATRTDDDRFRLELVGGHAVLALRVLAATDLVDEADGRRVGATISSSLADANDAPARPSANELDWDHRYEGDRVWSGNPNGALVDEIGGLTPGTALDVGAGEGGDAVWLAEQGWNVTASDISQRALDRLAAEAQRRGLGIGCYRADANALGAYGGRTFDLVTAQYASIPRTPNDRGIRNLLDAVGPGGRLLVVSHDLEPMRVLIDTNEHSRPFDPDAYVRVEDVATVLADSSDWAIEINEKRPRGPGSATAQHHVDDIVLRARRSADS